MKLKHSLLTASIAICLLLLSGCGKDEPTLPKIGFQTDSSDLAEGGERTVSFTLPLPAGVNPEISFSGTAEELTDFTFAITTAGLEFTAVEDGIYDPDETIVVTLSGFNKGAVVASVLEHTVTITETPLTVNFQAEIANRIEGQSIVAAFNQQLPDGVTPTYTVTGTAQISVDYNLVVNNNGFVVTTLKDQLYDNAETVILELTGISGNANIGTPKVYTITLTDEDQSVPAGLKIDLTWEALDLTTSDVDVDLMVWLETSPGIYSAQGGLWAAIIGTAPESTYIPISEPDGKYALSYVYFNGASDNLKLKVDFRSFGGNINTTSNRASFMKNYTLVNLNAYVDPYTQPLVVAQTFVKSGGNYTSLSDINVASTGSRSAAPVFILDEKAKMILESRRNQRNR